MVKMTRSNTILNAVVYAVVANRYLSLSRVLFAHDARELLVAMVYGGFNALIRVRSQ